MAWVLLALSMLIGGCSDNGDANGGSESDGDSSADGVVTEVVPTPELPGIAEVKLLTASSGVGFRPVLQWEGVDDAALYTVTVFTADGEPYWSWQGGAVMVPFGGGDAPAPEGAEGPVLAEGMSWVVTAWDEGETPVAISARMPIEP